MGVGDRFDAGATRPMTAGSFMVMPQGAHHYGWMKGETVVHVYAIGPWGITYVNPADDPRNQSKVSIGPALDRRSPGAHR
jgi:hypothetical protein